MQRNMFIYIGIATLAVLVATGCTQPNGLYVDGSGALFVLQTEKGEEETTISGTVTPASGDCNDVVYTIDGYKDSGGDDVVLFFASTTETALDGCLSTYCYFLNPVGNAWNTMAGDYCDCTAFPVVSGCEDATLTRVGPLPKPE